MSSKTARVTKSQANHIVARVSRVKEGDTKIQAAEKAIATMRMVGMPASAIRKAEKMLADFKARS